MKPIPLPFLLVCDNYPGLEEQTINLGCFKTREKAKAAAQAWLNTLFPSAK